MTSPVAIAAVTGAMTRIIRDVVDREVPGTATTALPPGRAAKAGANRLNIFLYAVARDGAYGNAGWRPSVLTTDTDMPPLALTLHYLVTPFVEPQENEIGLDERVLGWSMVALQQHPVLTVADLNRVLGPRDTALDDQVDNVRITLDPLSMDHMSRLWAAFQTDYRASVCYQAGVVLLGSAPTRIPRRVETYRPTVTSSTPAGTTLPMLTSVSASQPPAVPGSTVMFVGNNLEHITKIRFVAPDGTAAGESEVTRRLGRMTATVPVDIGPVGVHTVCGFGGADLVSDQTTNSLPLAITLHVADKSVTVNHIAGGPVSVVSLDVVPRVQPRQPTSLVLGEHAISIDVPSAAGGGIPDVLKVPVPALQPGTYDAWLQVAGLASNVFEVIVP